VLRRGHRAWDGATVCLAAARSWARAARLSGGCVGQGEWRRASPRWWHDDGAERRLGAAACGDVLTGGRVGGDSG
jgi:hypothetical protein